jgi:hypothetical protein
MRMTRGFVALVLTIALAAPCLAIPATALGQSAGDEQYVDPFQNDGNNDNNAQDNSGSGEQAATPPADTNTTTNSGSSDSAGTTASDSGTLPRTGLPLRGLTLTGLVLLGSGVALRRRA